MVDLFGQVVEVVGVKVLVVCLEGFDVKVLCDVVDCLKQQLGDVVIVLVGVQDGKVVLVVGVNGSVMGKVKVGELLFYIVGQIGGKGGGCLDFVQGGGEDGFVFVIVLVVVVEWVSFCL